MGYRYERYLTHLVGQPWAITEQKLAVIRDLMAFRASGGRYTDEELSARFDTAAQAGRGIARSEGGVAILPIHGVIAHRADTFEASSGGTSTEAVGRAFRRAMADSSVSTIVLDVDSPGGTVEGVPELAAEIYAARQSKRVIAHANAMAASAGYWLASQASELYVTPSGSVGSIGVYMLLEDWSEHLEKEGVKITPISAGAHKLDGAWWTPMSPEAREHFQAQIDGINREFVAAVARARGVTASVVNTTYGQGRVFLADDAKARGMVDGVVTLDQLLSRLVPRAHSGGPRAEADQDAIALAIGALG